jgi:hypothetical protein
MDEEFIGNLISHKNDYKFIHKNIFRMLNEKDHALYFICQMFKAQFREKFQTKGVAWLNLNDALLDIHLFSEKLASKLLDQWEDSFLNSDFGKKVCEESILLYLAMELFSHLFTIYRMQDNNKVKEKQIEKLFELTLEHLNVPKELLLSNEADPYSDAIYSLNEILDLKNPADMIKTISKTTQLIYQSISDYNNIEYSPKDNSELLPIFLYVVIRANVPELPSFLNYISDFGDLSKFDSTGEYGFNMLNSCLNWSLDVEPPQNWNVQTPSSVRAPEFPPTDVFENQEEVQEEQIEQNEQEYFDQESIYENNENEATTVEDDSQAQYIKELELEIDELYKEITKHMEIEQNYENEIHELKMKVEKLEKELKQLKMNNSPSPSISPSVSESFVIPKQVTLSQTKLLPFCVTVHESLDIKFDGKNLSQYKVIGQIGIQGYSKNQESEISSVDQHDFTLCLTDISKITGAINNPKYCKKIENSKNPNGLNLSCSISSSELFSQNKFQNVVLMKYNLKEGDVLLPIKIQPLFKMNNGNIELIINFTINPRFDKNPLDNLTIRATVLIKEKSTGKIIEAKKCVSKPENEFNESKQTAEWKYQTSPSNPDGSPQKILAKFFTFNDNLGECECSMNFSVQFQCSGVSLGEIQIDGCNGKKSITDEIFVGGSKHKIVFANMTL